MAIEALIVGVRRRCPQLKMLLALHPQPLSSLYQAQTVLYLVGRVSWAQPIGLDLSVLLSILRFVSWILPLSFVPTLLWYL